MTAAHPHKLVLLFLLAIFVAAVPTACGGDNGISDELDTDFNIPRTESFADNLSAYGLYQGELADLEPAQGVYLYEISSELFTDYAKKQRLVKLPAGLSSTVLNSRTADYPDGTVVAKTFFFPNDFRDRSLGRRVIETRLLVKTAGVWNVATYVWNDAQTDATLSLEGSTTTVRWVTESGQARSTSYEIPGEVACVTCHQSSDTVSLVGLTPRNVNRPVQRGGQEVDQLAHLQSSAVFAELNATDITTIVDYTDTSQGLEQRARAYLDVNCSHCHNPRAWDRAAREDLDLRYETALGQTGLLKGRDKIEDLLEGGEMPLVGTTVPHTEGIKLVVDYLDSL